MIEIKEARTKKDMKAFVRFPFQLYKGNPYWVPPIIQDELNTLDASHNPVFEQAKARFYLAYKEGKVAGRVAAIINTYEVEQQKLSKVRFGWFDVIDDIFD